MEITNSRGSFSSKNTPTVHNGAKLSFWSKNIFYIFSNLFTFSAVCLYFQLFVYLLFRQLIVYFCQLFVYNLNFHAKIMFFPSVLCQNNASKLEISDVCLHFQLFVYIFSCLFIYFFVSWLFTFVSCLFTIWIFTPKSRFLS